MIDYSVTAPELPQLMIPTSEPSGNSPNLIGGNSPSQAPIEQFRVSKQPLKELGNGIMVITDPNMHRIFDYLYQQYPALRQRTDTVDLFEQANQNNAFIWAEMADWPLNKVLTSLIKSSIKFYNNNNSNLNAQRQLKQIFVNKAKK